MSYINASPEAAQCNSCKICLEFQGWFECLRVESIDFGFRLSKFRVKGLHSNPKAKTLKL